MAVGVVVAVGAKACICYRHTTCRHFFFFFNNVCLFWRMVNCSAKGVFMYMYKHEFPNFLYRYMHSVYLKEHLLFWKQCVYVFCSVMKQMVWYIHFFFSSAQQTSQCDIQWTEHKLCSLVSVQAAGCCGRACDRPGCTLWLWSEKLRTIPHFTSCWETFSDYYHSI